MTICRCGHEEKMHGKKDCAYCDPKTLKFCKCKGFIIQSEKEIEMPKAKKETKTVVRYERTFKDAKRFEEKENESRAAIVYRAILKLGPVSLDDLFEDVKKDFQPFRGKAENIKGNIRTFLKEFHEASLVKKS